MMQVATIAPSATLERDPFSDDPLRPRLVYRARYSGVLNLD